MNREKFTNLTIDRETDKLLADLSKLFKMPKAKIVRILAKDAFEKQTKYLMEGVNDD